MQVERGQIRSRIEIYRPITTGNGSGGKSVDKSTKGDLVMSSLAEVKTLKPTRDQLAEQTRFGEQLSIVLWKQKAVKIDASLLLYYDGKAYSIQGPPVEAPPNRWTIYAKSMAL